MRRAEAKLETKLNIYVPSRKEKNRTRNGEVQMYFLINTKEAPTDRKTLEIRVRQNSPDSSCQA